MKGCLCAMQVQSQSQLHSAQPNPPHSSATFPYAYIANRHAPVSPSPQMNGVQHVGKPDERMHTPHALKTLEDSQGAPDHTLLAPQRPVAMNIQRASSAPMETQLLQGCGHPLALDGTSAQLLQTHSTHPAVPLGSHLSAADQQGLLQLTQQPPHDAGPGVAGDPHATPPTELPRVRPWSISAPQLACGVGPPDGHPAGAMAAAQAHFADSHAATLQLLLRSPSPNAPTAQLPWQPPPRALTPPPRLDPFPAPATATTGFNHTSPIPYTLMRPPTPAPLAPDSTMHVAPIATPATADPHPLPAPAHAFPTQLQPPFPTAVPTSAGSVTAGMHEILPTIARSPSCPSMPVATLALAHPNAADPTPMNSCVPYTVSTGAVRLPPGQRVGAQVCPPHPHMPGMHARTMPPAATSPLPLAPQTSHYPTTAAASTLREQAHGAPTAAAARSAHGVMQHQNPLGWGIQAPAPPQMTPAHHDIFQPPDLVQYPVRTPQSMHVAPRCSAAAATTAATAADGRPSMHGQHASWAPMQGVVQCAQRPPSHQQSPYGYPLAPLGYDHSVIQNLFGAVSALPGAVLPAGMLDSGPGAGQKSGPAATPGSVTPVPPQPLPAPAWPAPAAPPKAVPHPVATGTAATDIAAGSMLGMLAVSGTMDLLQLQQSGSLENPSANHQVV